jgi:hypothetical protein
LIYCFLIYNILIYICFLNCQFKMASRKSWAQVVAPRAPSGAGSAPSSKPPVAPSPKPPVAPSSNPDVAPSSKPPVAPSLKEPVDKEALRKWLRDTTEFIVYLHDINRMKEKMADCRRQLIMAEEEISRDPTSKPHYYQNHMVPSTIKRLKQIESQLEQAYEIKAKRQEIMEFLWKDLDS